MDLANIAKAIAIPSGFLLASYHFVFSQNAIPHIYSFPPQLSTPMFAKIFDMGSRTIVPLAAPTILGYSYLAYKTTDSTERTIYITSAALTISTLILTMTVMKPGINRLISISKVSELQAKAGVEAEVKALLQQWVAYNYVRASIHLSAGILGFSTMFRG